MQKQDENLSLLQWTCRATLQSSFSVFRDADIDASFYPYIGLTHTIRRKGPKTWAIRVSDHCRYAPRQVLEAIAMILGSKIVHKRPPHTFVQIYEHFRKDPNLEELVRERRLKKGRKNISTAEGVHHSPIALYREVNDRFFNNQVEVLKIGWGLRKGWRRLGHYDPVHHTITLSPALDSPKVPEFVVRYIVYHEMLHSLFEEDFSRKRVRHHSPEFHRAERAYPDFARAKAFLRKYFGTRPGKTRA
jgi:hypothetical protein